MKKEIKQYAIIGAACVAGVICWPLVLGFVVKDTLEEEERRRMQWRALQTMQQADAAFLRIVLGGKDN